LKAHFAAEGTVALLGHALGQHAGGEPPGLEHKDFPTFGKFFVEEHLRHLGGFAGTGGRLDDDAAHAPGGGAQGRTQLLDGEGGS